MGKLNDTHMWLPGPVTGAPGFIILTRFQVFGIVHHVHEQNRILVKAIL